MTTAVTGESRTVCRGSWRVSDADADRFEADLRVLMTRARSSRATVGTAPPVYPPVPWGPDVRDLLGRGDER